MKNSIKCVLLIDDDKVTNFYNKRVVNKVDDFKEVKAVTNGNMALNYLKDAINGLCIKPDLIFLDINMPAMNGWEFIEEYKKLDSEFTKSIKLVMLTTSNNPEDYSRSLSIESIDDYINKPLSTLILINLLEEYYSIAVS